MVNRLNRLLLLAVLSLGFLLLVPQSAQAIPDPANLTFYTTRAFQGVWEEGDILYVASYDIGYATAPAGNASSNFLLTLYNQSNSTALGTRPATSYQESITSIY